MIGPSKKSDVSGEFSSAVKTGKMDVILLDLFTLVDKSVLERSVQSCLHMYRVSQKIVLTLD